MNENELTHTPLSNLSEERKETQAHRCRICLMNTNRCRKSVGRTKNKLAPNPWFPIPSSCMSQAFSFRFLPCPLVFCLFFSHSSSIKHSLRRRHPNTSSPHPSQLSRPMAIL